MTKNVYTTLNWYMEVKNETTMQSCGRRMAHVKQEKAWVNIRIVIRPV